MRHALPGRKPSQPIKSVMADYKGIAKAIKVQGPRIPRKQWGEASWDTRARWKSETRLVELVRVLRDFPGAIHRNVKRLAALKRLSRCITRASLRRFWVIWISTMEFFVQRRECTAGWHGPWGQVTCNQTSEYTVSGFDLFTLRTIGLKGSFPVGCGYLDIKYLSSV